MKPKNKVGVKYSKPKTPSPFLNPKTGRISITDAFGLPLAELLAEKISEAYKEFPLKSSQSSTVVHGTQPTRTSCTSTTQVVPLLPRPTIL